MIKKLVPYTVRKGIQSTRLYSAIDSRRLASSTKRLDICAAQFAQLMSYIGDVNLRGKVCLELGAGWVLSHSLICYLLGAERIIATDIEANAHPENLKVAVHKSVLYQIRDLLAPFDVHADIRERLNRLLAIKYFDFEVLESLGIEYMAPVDWVKEPPALSVDFIYSFSVLEHVPVDNVATLVANLHQCLRERGLQAHVIHLEDHKDISGNPFEFLSIPKNEYGPHLESERGNRIRSSQWKNIFATKEGQETRILYEWNRKDVLPPTQVDPHILYESQEDLTVTHMGVVVRKT